MSCEKNNLIPVVESRVFIDAPKSRFALGQVAINDVILNGYESEFYGAAKLRANTYLDSGFVRADELDDNGTELDANDYSRSVHFAILERTATASLARVVGNMRLVIKGENNSSSLPIEQFCKDTFSEAPIPIGGVEVSRLIARHEDPVIQNLLKWPLFVAGQKYVEQNALGPVYGLITPALTRLLRSQRIPVSAVDEARYIAEINATKQPVQINLPVLKKLVGVAGDKGVDLSRPDFSYLDISELIGKK